MHIHQGHWSLSSSAWWTLLCNNQLIYILPSTAICVDYWEKATCARASALWDLTCAHALAPFAMDWFDLMLHTCFTPPRREHAHRHTWLMKVLPLRARCPAVPLHPVSAPSSPALLSGGQFLAPLASCKNPPWLPDCAPLGTWGPGCSLPVSAGQSLKAVRCDGADWQLGSHARGYQGSVSRERGCHRSGSPN